MCPLVVCCLFWQCKARVPAGGQSLVCGKLILVCIASVLLLCSSEWLCVVCVRIGRWLMAGGQWQNALHALCFWLTRMRRILLRTSISICCFVVLSTGRHPGAVWLPPLPLHTHANKYFSASLAWALSLAKSKACLWLEQLGIQGTPYLVEGVICCTRLVASITESVDKTAGLTCRKQCCGAKGGQAPGSDQQQQSGAASVHRPAQLRGHF